MLRLLNLFNDINPSVLNADFLNSLILDHRHSVTFILYDFFKLFNSVDFFNGRWFIAL